MKKTYPFQFHFTEYHKRQEDFFTKFPSPTKNKRRPKRTLDISYENFEKYEEEINNNIVRIRFGDLFTAPNECVLAHCVAEDMIMANGIALSFR